VAGKEIAVKRYVVRSGQSGEEVLDKSIKC
jgi:hypothetical protein